MTEIDPFATAFLLSCGFLVVGLSAVIVRMVRTGDHSPLEEITSFVLPACISVPLIMFLTAPLAMALGTVLNVVLGVGALLGFPLHRARGAERKK